MDTLAGLTARRYHVFERIRVVPVVVPIRELVQVERQVLLADVVERAHHAAFQKRPELVDIRGVDDATDILVLAVVHGFVRQTCVLVVLLFVGGEQFHLFRVHHVADEAGESARILSADDPSHDVALAGNSSDDADLAVTDFLIERAGIQGLPDLCALLVPVAVLILTADVGFIRFDDSGQREGIAPHGCPPAVAHVPDSVPVRAGILTEDHAADLQGTHAFLRSQHEVADLEPQSKRNLGVLKDRAGYDTESVAIRAAAFRVLAHPMKGAGLQDVDLLFGATARAGYPLRPPLCLQESLAQFVGCEIPFEVINLLHEMEFNT